MKQLSKRILSVHVLLSFGLVLFCTGISLAQNYQVFYSTGTSLFQQKESSKIQAMRMDSFTVENGDTILYPFSQAEEIRRHCVIPNGTSWIGKQVIIKENSDQLFFNKIGDTIRIRANANLGDRWAMYQYPNGSRVVGEVTSIQEEAILSITDSVKTIRLLVINQVNEEVLNHPLSKYTIQLSKHYGMLNTLNFSLFPNGSLKEQELVGLSMPKLGMQNLTWLEVHDFEVGDEIHVRFGDIPARGDGVRSRFIEKIKDKKILANGGIEYLIHLLEELREPNSLGIKLIDTLITKTYLPHSIFDRLPGEPGIQIDTLSNRVEDFRFYTQLDEEYLTKTIDLRNEIFYPESSPCYRTTTLLLDFGKYKYYKGLAGPYYRDYGPHGEAKYRELLYYKKDTIEWGTPMTIITSTKGVDHGSAVKISPNPASSFIDIALKNIDLPVQLSLYDVNGRIVQQQQLSESQTRLDIQASGLLFYQVRNSEGALLKSGKIIVQSN